MKPPSTRPNIITELDEILRLMAGAILKTRMPRQEAQNSLNLMLDAIYDDLRKAPTIGHGIDGGFGKKKPR